MATLVLLYKRCFFHGIISNSRICCYFYYRRFTVTFVGRKSFCCLLSSWPFVLPHYVAHWRCPCFRVRSLSTNAACRHLHTHDEVHTQCVQLNCSPFKWRLFYAKCAREPHATLIILQCGSRSNFRKAKEDTKLNKWLFYSRPYENFFRSTYFWTHKKPTVPKVLRQEFNSGFQGFWKHGDIFSFISSLLT